MNFILYQLIDSVVCSSGLRPYFKMHSNTTPIIAREDLFAWNGMSNLQWVFGGVDSLRCLKGAWNFICDLSEIDKIQQVNHK
jgi:hypothetical protein